MNKIISTTAILSLSLLMLGHTATAQDDQTTTDRNEINSIKYPSRAAKLKSKFHCTPDPDKKEVQTLFKDGGLKGAYISGTMKPLNLNNQAGLMFGGEFALVFGHKLNIGFSGYGLATDIRSKAVTTAGEPLYYELGYGGFFLEPVIGSHKLVHLTMPITLGAGGVSLNENRWNYDYTENDYGDRFDFFLIGETGLNLEVNIFKILRLDAGASYRFVNDVNLRSTSNSDLKGLNANITLKLGFF